MTLDEVLIALLEPNQSYPIRLLDESYDAAEVLLKELENTTIEVQVFPTDKS